MCLVAVLSPAVALALEPGTPSEPASLASIDFGRDCHPTNMSQSTNGSRRLTCGGLDVLVRMELMSPHVTSGPLFKLERAMTARMDSEDGYQSSWLPAGPGRSRSWRLLTAPSLSNAMAVATWVNGKPIQPGMAARLHMAWTSIVGAQLPPVIMTATPEVDWSNLDKDKRAAMLQRFVHVLKSWPDITAEVRHIASRSRLKIKSKA